MTDANGVAVILYTDEAVKKPSYQFCVDNVANALTYDPDDNMVDNCESK